MRQKDDADETRRFVIYRAIFGSKRWLVLDTRSPLEAYRARTLRDARFLKRKLERRKA